MLLRLPCGADMLPGLPGGAKMLLGLICGANILPGLPSIGHTKLLVFLKDGVLVDGFYSFLK